MNQLNEKAAFFPERLLQEMRTKADPIADPVVQYMMQSGQRDKLSLYWKIIESKEKSSSEIPLELQSYLSQTESIPLWVDLRRLERGQLFFARNARSILSILGCLSLPYCYAAADGAQVLLLSQRIHHDTYQRLAETAQFLLDVSSPKAFSTGNGIQKIQQVRLIHAISRYYASNSPQWNVQWGTPVNQEDMAGTNLAFSYIVLQGLQKLGFQWTKDEGEDFLYLWNVIGAMLGVDQQLLPNNLQEAYWLDRTISQRHFRHSAAGVTLTQALLTCLYDINKDSPISRNFIHAYMRYLLSNSIADMLEIPSADGVNALSPLFRSTNVLNALTRVGKWEEKPQYITQTLAYELKQGVDTHLRLPVAFG